LLKSSLNFGALSGLACFAVFLLLYFAAANPLGNSSWLAAWIPVVIICISTKHYRENELEGFISYGQAWNIGALTGIAGAILHALLMYIFLKVYDNSLVESFKAENIRQLESMESQLSNVFSSSVYDTALESYQRLDVKTVCSSDFFNKTIGAILVSLITAAVYKRNKPKQLIQPDSEPNA
jgi:Protein of unknown function (DUF4199)